MKPKLLLSVNRSSCGTTSLYHTIWNSKYAHGGIVKESQYLYRIQSPYWQREIDTYHKNKPWSEVRIVKPWSIPKDVFKTSLNEEAIDDYFRNEERSLGKYVKYYHRLWETVKDDFQSVADFSNMNGELTEEFLMSIKDELVNDFDVKVIMIFRDPIRRLWSICNRRSGWENVTPESLLEKYTDANYKPIKHPFIRYVDMYERHVKVWGKEKVKFIISEDFFKGETQSLSNFLEFDILPPVIKSDRTYSMKYDIDSETWRYAYKKYKWLYDEFENTFGFIPDAWIDTGFYK